MIRGIIVWFFFALLLSAAGCGTSGQQQAVVQDDGFRRQNEQFERDRADHMKKSSEAVRDHMRYRNR